MGRTSGFDSLFRVYLDISLKDSTLLQSYISRIDLFSLSLRVIGGEALAVAGSPEFSMFIISDILMA